jgi:hypothetical protein
MHGIPSVRESWSCLPRPPRLLLHSNNPWGTAACDGSTRRSVCHSVPRRSWAATHLLAGLQYHFEITRYKIQKSIAGKDAGPTHGFTASHGVGPGATVDSLKAEYPHIQALSQDKGQDGRSFAPTCPVAPAPASWLRAAPEPPCVPWLQPPPPSSGQLRSCHMSRGSSSCLLAQCSSGAATCPMGALRALGY